MSSLPLFGLLILDREHAAPVHFLGLFQAWLQDAGGFAALGLLAYIAYALRTPPEQAESAKHRSGVNSWMLLMAVLATLCYAGYFALILTGKGRDTVNLAQYMQAGPGTYVKHEPPQFATDYQPLVLTLGGLFALLGIGQPFAASLARIRFRRIWALTILGFKEAVRSRLFWVFLFFLIPVLFPTHWFYPGKAEDQLRTTIGVTGFVSMVLLLLSAGLLAAFSIPNDIKNQNIYTVLTKPVERFEIVLGRFFGYGFLLSIALVGMTTIGWLFIFSTKVDESAASESYLARDPVRGTLEFRSRRELRGERFEGTNVGREFDYRRYIAGDPSSSQRAVWHYASVPSSLGKNGDSVPCEFTFDIFRMTKGEENRGVDMTIRVVTWQTPQIPPRDQGDGTWRWADPARQKAYEDDLKKAVEEAGFAGQNPAAVVAGARPGTPAWKVVNDLAKKYGYYEFAGKEVFDYQFSKIAVPSGIFENAREGYPPKLGENEPTPPMVSVFVNCTTRGQMVGMAEGDLYFLRSEPVPSHWAFAQNYFKSAFGLWCRMMLVIGLAVTCSTYFAGVIGFLITAALYLGGYFSEHIADVAKGSYLGGPFKAMNQLLEAKAPTAQMGDTPVEKAALTLDTGFSWLVRRVINLIPDIDAFTWTSFLSEGFNIPPAYLLMNLAVLVGYLLPWFILAFYLMRSREVAA
ncbi:MAG: hypothetical protein LC104_18960 [Bacteroidales bacterium]|nr:hypothetical protein [Bacteroidales bacterium]